MFRTFTLMLLFATVVVWPASGRAEDATPRMEEPEQGITYELLINGESFLVEGNRVVKVRSEKSPDTEYQVAVRIAPTQRYRMPTLVFAYERPAVIERDSEGGQSVARVIHELGYTMLIHDLGGTLDQDAQKQALDILTESVASSFRDLEAREIKMGKPHSRKFGENDGMGLMIQYTDPQDLGHTCLVYVLAGKEFSATCVIQYLDGDQEDVLPLVRKTLDSFASP
ncbi:MAG: hypothetical protein U1E05_08005 [Patescibacteria group bacterium]|nr:hypothetical protein [Patescibacteria group bacterium]